MGWTNSYNWGYVIVIYIYYILYIYHYNPLHSGKLYNSLRTGKSPCLTVNQLFFMTIFNSYVTNYQRVATGPYFPVTYQIGNQTPKIMRYNHSGFLRGRRHEIPKVHQSTCEWKVTAGESEVRHQEISKKFGWQGDAMDKGWENW